VLIIYDTPFQHRKPKTFVLITKKRGFLEQVYGWHLLPELSRLRGGSLNEMDVCACYNHNCSSSLPQPIQFTGHWLAL
jgi:hypothetical protein